MVVNDGKPLLLERKYETVKWLYRYLETNIDIGGYIVSCDDVMMM